MFHETFSHFVGFDKCYFIVAFTRQNVFENWRREYDYDGKLMAGKNAVTLRQVNEDMCNNRNNLNERGLKNRSVESIEKVIRRAQAFSVHQENGIFCIWDMDS